MLVVQGEQELRELLHEQRRKPERELVDGKQTRLGHQRATDRHHLLLPARGPPRRAVTELMELRQELVHTVEPLTDIAPRADVAERRGDDLEAEDAAVRTE